VVGVEGASHPVDVSALGRFKTREVKQDVGQYFVRQGLITGAEYYAATGAQTVRLEGIEDAALYQANRDSVQKFLTDESQGYVYDLRELLENQKARVFRDALKAHDRHRVLFREGKESLLKYSLYLAGAVKRAGYGLGSFSQLSAYVSARQDGFGRNVDPDTLYQELERAEEVLREGLYAGADDRALDVLCARLDIMEKLVNISASAEELAAYRRSPENFRVKPFLEFLQAHLAQGEPEPDAELFGLDEFVKETETFYWVADERSRVFVDRMERALNQNRETAGVMITGGFHTADILAELERRGIGYVSVRPRLTQLDLVNPYFSLMKGRRTPLEKMLAQNQNILSMRTKFRENGVPQDRERTTFSHVLDYSVKEGLAGFLAAHGKRTVAEIKAGHEAVIPAQDSGVTRIDWEHAQGNETAGVFLLPAKVGEKTVVGLIRPQGLAGQEVENAGVIAIGKTHELVVLSETVAAAQAEALLKGGAQFDLQGLAVQGALLAGPYAFALASGSAAVKLSGTTMTR
jgi:hypothetical protein